MADKRSAAGPMDPNNVLNITQVATETGAQAMARNLLEPHLRHAFTASGYANKLLGTAFEAPGLMDYVDHVQVATKRAETGDLGMASRILAAQAITLDSMFSEFARRAAQNMGEYIDAAERYSRMALKAQGNCRATLEALAKLHQPREQTVRHVHVNEGGQAIVADELHVHSGDRSNDKNGKQSNAACVPSASSALPSSNESGSRMPIAGGQRQATVQNARRHQSGRA